VLGVLESERAASATPFWFGPAIGHADIAVACALRFVGEAHSGLIDADRYPTLTAHAGNCEALPVFREIAQPFLHPA
jgi:glutathione S-transferase